MALRRLFRREPDPPPAETNQLADEAPTAAAPGPAPSVPTPYPNVSQAVESGDTADAPHRHVFQHNQTDMDFLLKRADHPSTLADLEPGWAEPQISAASDPQSDVDVEGMEIEDVLDL